jgi:hypothetical protein
MSRLVIARALACCAVLAAPMTHAQEFAQRRALLFAVDEYEAQGVPTLQFAQRDARSLADRLTAQGYTVTTFFGTDTTRENVVKQLLLAQEKLRPQDSFVLYYAGHGVRRPSNGQVYWLNYDGEPRRPDIDGLRLTHLIELVREIPAGRKLVLLDHCYAGDVSAPTSAMSDGRDADAASPALTQPREAFPIGFAEDIRSARAAGGGDTSMFVVAASRGVALEDPNLMHGFFTAMLLKALRSADADTPAADGGLTMLELMNFIRKNVTELSGSRQQPFLLPPETSDITSALEWQPFIRALTAAEVSARQQKYIDRLREWTNRQLLTPDVQTQGEQLLQRWQNAPTALSPNDELGVATLRLLIDTPPPSMDDAQVAAELARQMRLLSEP